MIPFRSQLVLYTDSRDNVSAASSRINSLIFILTEVSRGAAKLYSYSFSDLKALHKSLTDRRNKGKRPPLLRVMILIRKYKQEKKYDEKNR